MYQRNLVAFQNANGRTIGLFERTFDGEPWGYGQTSYRRIEFDVIVEPKPVAARVAFALFGLVAALAPLVGVVLLAMRLPSGLA